MVSRLQRRWRLLWLVFHRASTHTKNGIAGQISLAARFSRVHLLSLVLAVIMGVLVGVLVINFGTQVIQSTQLEGQRTALLAEVEQLQQENLQLQGAVEYAESDVNVERIAREQLGYARENEVVLLPQIVVPTPAPVAVVARPVVLQMAQPNWHRWWAAFFPSQSSVTSRPLR